jgi:chromosomal replication initiator protein
MNAVQTADILEGVSGHFGITVKELLGGGKHRHARRVAIYLVRDLRGSSFSTIGRQCGGLDHTNALLAFRSIQRKMEIDAAFAAVIAVLKARIENEAGRPLARQSRGRRGLGGCGPDKRRRGER